MLPPYPLYLTHVVTIMLFCLSRQLLALLACADPTRISSAQGCHVQPALLAQLGQH